MPSSRPQVLVIGGGPAGATSALRLADAGIDVTLIDRARFPREKICGESLSPGAVTRLQKLGVWPLSSEAGSPPWMNVRGMRLSTSNGATFLGRYRHEPSTVGAAVRRRDLDAHLLRSVEARGVTVIEGVEALSATIEEEGGAAVRVRTVGRLHESVMRAERVVVADGRRSFLARQLGFLARAPEPPSARRWAVRAHCEGVEGLSQFAEMHVSQGGYCGLAPLSQNAANVSYVLLAPVLQAGYRDGPTRFRHDLNRFPGIARRLEGARFTGPVEIVGPLRLRGGGRLANGPFFACGDTTGFLDPFTGEGIAHAIASGAAAATAIIDSLRGGEGAAAQYEADVRALRRFKGPAALLLHALVSRPSLADAAGSLFARAPHLADAAVRLFGDQV